MIVLLGGTGYVGSYFRELLCCVGEKFLAPNRHAFDHGRQSSVESYLKSVNASFVINATGYVGRPNVDACEANKKECAYVNIAIPLAIAEACHNIGLRWGHVSSGCIYQGDGGRELGYREEDRPNFSFANKESSYYSKCKGYAEERIKRYPSAYIWRLRMPISRHKDDPRSLLNKFSVYDQILRSENSVSVLDDFVKASYQTYKHNQPTGIYNIVNPKPVTSEFLTGLLVQAGWRDKPVKYFDSERDFMKIATARRSSCVLDSSKISCVCPWLKSSEERIIEILKAVSANTTAKHYFNGETEISSIDNTLNKNVG